MQERRGRTELEGLVLQYIDESEALKGANVGVYFEVRRSPIKLPEDASGDALAGNVGATHCCNAHVAGCVSCGLKMPRDAAVLSP
jgi:hypothetical protein